MSDEIEAGSASAVHEVREPVYVIGLGNAVVLRLSAYGVLLAFLAAGVFGALTSSRPGPTSIG